MERRRSSNPFDNLDILNSINNVKEKDIEAPPVIPYPSPPSTSFPSSWNGSQASSNYNSNNNYYLPSPPAPFSNPVPYHDPFALIVMEENISITKSSFQLMETEITANRAEIKRLVGTLSEIDKALEKDISSYKKEIERLNLLLKENEREKNKIQLEFENEKKSFSKLPIPPLPTSLITMASNEVACDICTFINPITSKSCQMCNSPLNPPSRKSTLGSSSTSLFEKAIKESCCAICMERPQVAIAVPCGHNSTCMECAALVARGSSKNCPICQMKVSQFIRFYPV